MPHEPPPGREPLLSYSCSASLQFNLDMHPPTWFNPKLIADLVNPALAVWLIWIALGGSLPTGWNRARFLLQAGGAILLVFVVLHLPRWLHLHRWLSVWPEQGHFLSGHTGFAVAVATSLAVARRRTLWVTVPLLAAYGVLIVLLEYHVWLDVVGTWMLAPPLALVCFRRGRSARERTARTC